MLKKDAEQSTDFVHLKRTLNVLLTNKPEIESVAVNVSSVFELTMVESDELIVIELTFKLNQAGMSDADQVIFVGTPAGLVTIVGSAIVRVGAPI